VRLAVTSTGPGLDSPMDPRFGRARYLLFVEDTDRTVFPVDNEAGVNAAHGAGIQAAQNLIDHSARVLITGHCGPKAYQVLATAGIDVYLASGGTAEEAVRRYEAGELLQQSE
jgi:predicted Fe-Mo cluster-binding NifX family protein